MQNPITKICIFGEYPCKAAVYQFNLKEQGIHQVGEIFEPVYEMPALFTSDTREKVWLYVESLKNHDILFAGTAEECLKHLTLENQLATIAEESKGMELSYMVLSKAEYDRLITIKEAYVAICGIVQETLHFNS